MLREEHVGWPLTGGGGGGGVLTATPGSSARQTRGKGTLKGLAQGFQKPSGLQKL